MRRRPVCWAVRLYPRGWKRRYGAQVADLAAQLARAKETTLLGAAMDLVAFDARERASALRRSYRIRPALHGQPSRPVQHHSRYQQA
jgi:hypothetical protein